MSYMISVFTHHFQNSQDFVGKFSKSKIDFQIPGILWKIPRSGGTDANPVSRQ